MAHPRGGLSLLCSLPKLDEKNQNKGRGTSLSSLFSLYSRLVLFWDSWRAMLTVLLPLLPSERQQIHLHHSSYSSHAGLVWGKGLLLAITCTSLSFLFLSFTYAGAGVRNLIRQWPGEILKRAGETVDICYQSCNTLAYMFWYQQSPSNVLKLVAGISTWMQNSYEEGCSEVKFETNRDNNEYSVMMIKNLTPKDAAMYFCVASDHMVQKRGWTLRQNPHLAWMRAGVSEKSETRCRVTKEEQKKDKEDVRE